jgi:hypothetical protein
MQLERTEARIFTAWWQDGLIDLLAGIGITLIGVAWLLGWPAIGAAVPAMIVPLWGDLRSRITEGRLGRVRFSAERRRKLTRGNVAAIGLGALLLVINILMLVSIDTPSAWLRSMVPALPALLLALMGVVASLMLGLPRFLAYSAALGVAGLVVAAFDLEPGWAIAGGGIVIAIAGATLLRRFLAEFPRLSETIG